MAARKYERTKAIQICNDRDVEALCLNLMVPWTSSRCRRNTYLNFTKSQTLVDSRVSEIKTFLFKGWITIAKGGRVPFLLSQSMNIRFDMIMFTETW